MLCVQQHHTFQLSKHIRFYVVVCSHPYHIDIYNVLFITDTEDTDTEEQTQRRGEVMEQIPLPGALPPAQSTRAQTRSQATQSTAVPPPDTNITQTVAVAVENVPTPGTHTTHGCDENVDIIRPPGQLPAPVSTRAASVGVSEDVIQLQ